MPFRGARCWALKSTPALRLSPPAPFFAIPIKVGPFVAGWCQERRKRGSIRELLRVGRPPEVSDRCHRRDPEPRLWLHPAA